MVKIEYINRHGYEKDQETDLHYAGARYYDSWLSIFNSTDPMWYKYPHLSPYAYCADNPINYIDPNGMDTVPANEIWNYSTTNYKTNGTYGIYKKDNYANVISDGVLYSLHEIESGENKGNFLAIANYGKTEEGIDIFEYKYIVGKDKVQDFLGGQIEPVGLRQSLIETAILLGTKYDNKKSIIQNYFSNWWECTSNMLNYLPEPSVKVKYGSWNTFLKNSKGMYNKRNFNGIYKNALKQRSIDYYKWQKTTKTLQIGK